MQNSDYSIEEFVTKKNSEKFLFTAGPASLAKENLTGLRPCFGRGDDDYNNLEERVFCKLKNLQVIKN